MVWSTPPNWSTGDPITQQKLQTVTDDLNALHDYTYTKKVNLPPFPDNFNGAVVADAAIWYYQTAGLGWNAMFVSGAAGNWMRFSWPIENDWAGGDIVLKAAMYADASTTVTPKIYWGSKATNSSPAWDVSNASGSSCSLTTNIKHFTVYTFTAASGYLAVDDVLYAAWHCQSASYGVGVCAAWLEYTAKVFP